MFKLAKFTTSDECEEHEGYTDGSIYDKWANVYFTKDQVKAYLDSTPYDYRFITAGDKFLKRDYPVLLIYWDDNDEFIESTPIPTDEGFLTGYYMPGEWMLVE